MEQESTTTTEAPEPSVGAEELIRPKEGRVLGGVSQGLANRYDVPVWLPRVLFALTAFFGGVGVALYLAGWALIRSEDEEESPAAQFFSGASTSRAWIGIGLIFVAALILLDNFTFFSGGVVFAVGLLVVGILLYLGQIPVGTSRSESKEGVQQMTTTDTQPEATLVDDSPADATPPPPPPPTPTPTPPGLPPAPAKPKETSILGRLTIGVMILAVGVLAVLDNIDGVPVYPEPRHYLALAVVILGLGLLVGTLWGRARWLILVGVVLVPTLLFSPVFEYEWNTEAFDVVHQPQAFVEIEEVYAIDLGNMVIDLTDLPWDGQTTEVTARIDAGNLEIYLPDDVGLIGSATVDVGRVGARGRESAGIGEPSLSFNEQGATGTVVLDAHVDLGNIEIHR